MTVRRKMLVTALATCALTVLVTARVTLWWWNHRVAAERSPTNGSEVEPASAEPPRTAAGEPVARTIPAPALDHANLTGWAAGDERVATVDLDGDGASEIALAGADLRVVTMDGRVLGTFPAPGGIGPLEGIRGSFYAGWGRSKSFPTATAIVTRYGDDGRQLVSETVATPASERPQIVAIGEAGGSLVLAWFKDKYTVEAQRAARGAGGWSMTPWTTARTAPVWLVADLDRDGRDDLLIGRTYGDAPASDGDATLLRAAGERVAVPTTRGVRAGCVADTDGDGRPEVVLADGWDKDYGHKARAQVRLVTWEGNGVVSVLLDRIAGEHDVTRLIAADIDGDGRDEILAVTDSRLRVVEREGAGWVAWDAGTGVLDSAVLADGRIVTVGAAGELLTRTR